MSSEIGIIGGGAWGTAIAIMLASNNYSPVLYVKDQEQASEINNKHTNNSFIQSITLSPLIRASANLQKINQHSVIIIATPSHAYHSILEELQGVIVNQKVIFCIASKGIDNQNLQLLSVATQSYFPNHTVSVIAGPNLAQEVAELLPCAITVACEHLSSARFIANFFTSPRTFTQVSDDVITIQVASSFKNVIAILGGIITAKGYGENCKAYVISQGLKEIYLLAKALGGRADALFEFGIVGDLVLTSYSNSSRNTKFGKLIGTYDNDHKAANNFPNFLVEGIQATKLLYTISQKFQINLPILKTAYDILHNQIIPDDALNSLFKHGQF